MPLKEALDKENTPSNWDNLRKARNALCHGTYSFNTDGSIVFKDQHNARKKETTLAPKEITLTPKEIVELSNQAYGAYEKQQANKAIPS